MKLSDTTIKALKPAVGQRLEIPDAGLAGLVLRVSSTSKVWYVQGRVPHGRWVRIKVGPWPTLSVAKARQKAKTAIGNIAGGTDPRDARRAARAKGLTVREALESFLKHKDQVHKASYQADCRRMLGAELAKLADKRVTALDGKAVETWFKAQKATVAAKSGRVLRAALNYASKTLKARGPDGEVATDALAGLWPKPTRKSCTLAAPLQWAVMIHQVPEPVANLFRSLAFLGLRRDELRLAPWGQLDMQQMALTLPDPKGRKKQLVPLPRQVCEIVERIAVANPLRLPDDAIFSADEPRQPKPIKSRRGKIVQHGRPLGTSTLQRWVTLTSKSTGNWSLHDLRRTFISKAVDIGVPTYVVKKLVHHADGNDVTAGYVSLDVERLRQHAQRVADALFVPCGQVVEFRQAAE